MKSFVKFLLLSFVALFLYDCARKGRPSGGPKDETAPILVTANPPNETLNFNKKKIKIYFDEYIVLKDLNKQLVVSPPMKNPPLISPQGTPSKYITIEVLDTLRPNTTYTFNFGNAVQDNNENNKLESFKYVFSTGSYIDSLTLKGSVKDAFDKEDVKDISVLLYKYDSTYRDSIIFKEKPFYVTNTLDSSNYEFSNLQKGKYLLLALKEDAKDYIFNSRSDKIAFSLDTITLPKDSVVSQKLELFKELQAYKFKRGKEVMKGKIQFGYEGERVPKLTLLSKTPDDFNFFTQKEKDKDTLNYWFTPFETDSLMFTVQQGKTIDTSKVFLRKKKIDSLSVAASESNTLHLKDTLFFRSNNPIVTIDSTKFTLFNKDTVAVKFQLKKESINEYAMLFKQQPSNLYRIKVLPNAFTDVFNVSNKDTLSYNLTTKAIDDYGNITLNIENKVQKPLIIELISQNKVVTKKFLNGTEKIEFSLLKPGKYNVRAIIDKNNNKKWDTGNFLQKNHPETVLYFENEINLRANWDVVETFTIK